MSSRLFDCWVMVLAGNKASKDHLVASKSPTGTALITMHQPSIRDLLAQMASVTQACRQIVERSLGHQQHLQSQRIGLELKIQVLLDELERLKQT